MESSASLETIPQSNGGSVSNDLVEMMAQLVKRGLNLCAESRNLQKAMNEAPDEHCLTPYAWAHEEYEKYLAQWEEDAAKTLREYGKIREVSLSVAQPLLKEALEALERIAEMTDIETDFDGFQARAIARETLSKLKRSE